MNEDVKRRWVDALRSGEFVQGRGKLHKEYLADDHPDELCCLGVLCLLAFRDDVVTRHVNYEHGDHRSYAYDGDSNFLPTEVSRWAGLDGANDPAARAGNYHVTLSTLNDDNHLNFAQIAQIVEEQL